MENKEVIQQLFSKYLSGQCTEKEIETLMQYFSMEQGDFLHQLVYNYYAGDTEEDFPVVPLSVYEKINSQINRKTVKLWPRFVAAASIAILVMTGGYLYYQSKYSKPLAESAYANDVAPGKNGATLTLANGQKILINDALTGNIATQSGVKISKTKDGQIIYEVTSTDNSKLAYNTLTTTRGQQSQVRLPDGTLVFLNSESSLRYPTSFTKRDKRSVVLEGEGFFEVSKDKKHPFVVKTRGQEIEVLGTKFNVNGYSDERLIKTTLVEGSVKVTTLNSGSRILKPDQQAVNSGDGLEIIEVEAQFFVDWKEGFFMFDNESLESITKRISRWYNIRVVYEEPALKTKTFVGTISKYENISKVIQTLEGTGMASFRLNQGVLTISKKTGN